MYFQKLYSFKPGKWMVNQYWNKFKTYNILKEELPSDQSNDKNKQYTVFGIDKLFSWMGWKKYFCNVSNKSGNHRIVITPKNVKTTAFTSKYSPF